MNRREFFLSGALAIGSIATRPRVTFGAQAEIGLGGSSDEALQLNWNENPLGMSPAATDAAIEAVSRGNRYPDALRQQLIGALAERHEVGAESIVLGNGSTEILQVVVQANAEREPLLVLAEPTFGAILRYQRPFPYRVVRVPLGEAYSHDLMAMRSAAGEGPALVYLCNPNNPTATLTPSKEIDNWIAKSPESVVFLVDEAYYDYVTSVGFWSAKKWISDHPNVIVTRTFSKIYGMAGMHLGYALAHPQTAARLRGFTPTDNANGPALAAALASLQDTGWVEKSRDSNRRAMEITVECLQELGLGALPSHTNFLMHRIKVPLDAYVGRMRSEGVRVGRPFPPMLSYNRLTLGLPEQMERFTEVLREFRARGWV